MTISGQFYPSVQTRRSILVNALAAGPALAGAGVFSSTRAHAQTEPAASEGKEVIAATAYGKVRGVEFPDGLKVFKGIPYGDNMTGANRFMKPAPPKPWTGVRDALDWGSRCPQLGGSAGDFALYFGFITDEVGGVGEDCLVLNIWTKGTRDGKKRPVIVRIHGGGFSGGHGNHPMYRGYNVARRGDVVFVNLNHRIGVLGFLDLSDIAGPSYAESGNAGMLDLVAALTWIRDNIENFGGDPNNVMIAGESGGGAKVSTLLGMPAAKGLFHRAVIESGATLTARTKAPATELSQRILHRLHINSAPASALQDLPVSRLMEGWSMATSNLYFPADPPVPRHMAFGPVVDGKVIPQNMFDPAAPAFAADVPVMVGYNKDEATFMMASDNELYGLDEAGVKKRVEAILSNAGSDAGPAAVDRVIATYRRLSPGASASELMIKIDTDTVLGVRSVLLAERKAAQKKAPVFMFRFDWPCPAFDGHLGATHGIEIPFVNDTADTMDVMTHRTPEALALAGRVSDAWIAFARHGDPSTSDFPHWPHYTADKRLTMVINESSHVVSDPITAEVRNLWSDLKLA